MKLTKSKLKQLIKEEIKAVREEYSDNESIFDPSTYEGMFVSEEDVIDSFEESLTEFVSNYLQDIGPLGDNKIEKLKTAVMTALEGANIAEDEEDDVRDMVKAALENIEAANSTGDLK